MTPEAYEEALELIEDCMDNDPEGDWGDISDLVDLVVEYEKKHFPI